MVQPNRRYLQRPTTPQVEGDSGFVDILLGILGLGAFVTAVSLISQPSLKPPPPKEGPLQTIDDLIEMMALDLSSPGGIPQDWRIRIERVVATPNDALIRKDNYHDLRVALVIYGEILKRERFLRDREGKFLIDYNRYLHIVKVGDELRVASLGS